MVRIFLVDDHEVVRRGLTELFDAEDDLEVVGEAGTAEQALTRVASARPDVAVLDIVMPVMNGVAAAYEMRRIDPSAKIVFISSHYTPGDASVIARLLGAGAFVQKAEIGKALIPAIKQLVDPGSQPA